MGPYQSGGALKKKINPPIKPINRPTKQPSQPTPSQPNPIQPNPTQPNPKPTQPNQCTSKKKHFGSGVRKDSYTRGVQKLTVGLNKWC